MADSIESRAAGSLTASSGAGQARRADFQVRLVLTLPLAAYLAMLWLVKPLEIGGGASLSLAAPALLLLAALLLRIPREQFVASARSLAVAFSLLAVIVALSLLSLSNSESPVRSLRIIFPSLLPFALFLHLVLVRVYARDLFRAVTRFQILFAFLFSVCLLLVSMAVPAIGSRLFGDYRFQGFFENSIQHSIALATVFPLLVAEYLVARRLRGKIFLGALLLVLAYTGFRAGSKTAMAVCFATSVSFYLIAAIRSRSFVKIAFAGAVLAFLGVFLYFFGFQIAEQINPVIAEKLRSIVEGGVSNYQSIESRRELWREAMEQGKRHWLVGTGAGEMVLGVSHAHNLVLDYFKGIGIFGAVAIAGVCLAILVRTGRKTLSILAGRGDERDLRILACYLGSTTYVICNQLSDCFGPSTVGFLWVGYLCGVMMERQPGESDARR